MIFKIIFTVLCISIVALIVHVAEMAPEELAAWLGDDDYRKDMGAK